MCLKWDALYFIVYLDCIFVKASDSGCVINKAVFLVEVVWAI